MNREWLVVAMILGGTTSACANSWISELSPWGWTAQSGNAEAKALPSYVEILNLPAQQAGQLVVVDASPDSATRRGKVLQIVNLPAVSAGVNESVPRLIASAPWPDPITGFQVTVAPDPWGWFTNAGQLRQVRVMLFQGRTSLAVNLKVSANYYNGASLQDVVSFGPAGNSPAVPHALEPVIQLDSRQAIGRPYRAEDFTPFYQTGAAPPYAYLWDVPALDGHFARYSPDFALSPGLVNATWTGHTPEPGTLVLSLALGGSLALARPRRASSVAGA